MEKEEKGVTCYFSSYTGKQVDKETFKREANKSRLIYESLEGREELAGCYRVVATQNHYLGHLALMDELALTHEEGSLLSRFLTNFTAFFEREVGFMPSKIDCQRVDTVWVQHRRSVWGNRLEGEREDGPVCILFAKEGRNRISPLDGRYVKDCSPSDLEHSEKKLSCVVFNNPEEMELPGSLQDWFLLFVFGPLVKRAVNEKCNKQYVTRWFIDLCKKRCDLRIPECLYATLEKAYYFDAKSYDEGLKRFAENERS